MSNSNAVDVAALAAYAGKYQKKLFSTLVNMLDFASDLTILRDIKNSLNLTKLTVGKGARPYSKVFEAKGGDLGYTPRVLSVLMGKRDISIHPNDYRSTWMSEVMRPGVNPHDIPFAAYVWDQVLKELAAEINDRAIYFGFDKGDAVAFAGGDTYSEGDYITFASNGITDYYKCIADTTAGQSPTTHPAKWEMVNAEAITIGLAKRIADAVAASSVKVISTGALASDSAYEQFTAMWRGLPVSYRKYGACIYGSWGSSDFLQDDIENKVGKYVEIDDKTNIMYLRKTGRKCIIKPSTWMGDSGRLIATPKENLLVGTDQLSDMNKINVDKHLRTLDAGIDFALGTQIRDLDAMVVNDQE